MYHFPNKDNKKFSRVRPTCSHGKTTSVGENVVCLTTVVMALHGNIGVLTMNVGNSSDRS